MTANFTTGNTTNPNGNHRYPFIVWCRRGKHYIAQDQCRLDSIGRKICLEHGGMVRSQATKRGFRKHSRIENEGWFSKTKRPSERNLKTADGSYKVLHDTDKEDYHRKLQGVTCGFCTGNGMARREAKAGFETGLERRNPGNAV